MIRMTMATIKSYTDLQQSKKLAKFLPLESADMYYPWYIEEDRDNIKSGHRISIPSVGNFIHKVNILPCWSLTALLNVLPEYNLQRTDWGNKTEYKIVVTTDEDNYASKNYDNPVDACVAMIEKLNELNLL